MTDSTSLETESGASTTGWDYSPAPERVQVDIADSYGLFIDGEFVAPSSRRRFKTINPADEQTLSSVAEGGEQDVDDAVQAAKAALPRWSRAKPQERAKYLFRIARRIQERGPHSSATRSC